MFCHHRLVEYFTVFWDRTSCWSLKMKSPRSPSLAYVIYEYFPPGYSSSAALHWSYVGKVSTYLPMDTGLLKLSLKFLPQFHGPYKSMWERKWQEVDTVEFSSSLPRRDHLTITQNSCYSFIKRRFINTKTYVSFSYRFQTLNYRCRGSLHCCC